MGMKKVNTTAYHPQTDGLLERFNHTLTGMLAKTVKKDGSNWDKHLPYVLYANRTSPQESTKESSFFLLYGRDSRLPTDQAQSPQPPCDVIDVDTYKSEVFQGLSAAWKLACEKTWAENPAWPSCVGDCVFVLMPAKQLGKAHKFARPYGGLYRTVAMCENGAEVKVIDKSVLTLSESPVKDSSSNVERPPLDWVATADQAQSRVWQNCLSPRQWPSKDSAWSQGWGNVTLTLFALW